MLTQEARQQLATTAGGRRLSFVVHVDADAETSGLRAIGDRGQRRDAIDQAYMKAKRPFLDAMKGYGRLKVIDCLEGTPALIVSGPAETWRRLIRERAEMVEGPTVELKANIPHFAFTDEPGLG